MRITATLLIALLAGCTPWDDPTTAQTPLGDADGDGFLDPEFDGDDCDDTDPFINPSAIERVADGIDQDCDGFDDCHLDGDGDGFGDPDDVAPGPIGTCVGPGVSDNARDCDDGSLDVNPDAVEACNDIDDDCDGAVDNVDTPPGYLLDHDGDGDLAFAYYGCTPPTGYVAFTQPFDCDDFDATTFPDASEIAGDGIDQDCDGNDACYADADGDGFGNATRIDGTTLDCSADGESPHPTDCNDVDATVSPLAAELCGTADRDCDGIPGNDDDDAVGRPLWYPDADGDGHGDSLRPVGACVAPPNHLDSPGDCNDSNAAISPSAAEICNGIDDDCDAAVDDDDSNLDDAEVWYLDFDQDGWGSAAAVHQGCAPVELFTASEVGDCNDTYALVNPGADEIVGNDVDENCDETLSCYDDLDGDGLGGFTVVRGHHRGQLHGGGAVHARQRLQRQRPDRDRGHLVPRQRR
jgi:hypothetical protein